MGRGLTAPQLLKGVAGGKEQVTFFRGWEVTIKKKIIIKSEISNEKKSL